MNIRFRELDALRGVASLLVVFFHFTMGRSQAEYGFKYGVAGVDLFFIISGFVIFMSITKVGSTKEFLVNRISRLYPTYWTCVLITFAIHLLISYIDPIKVAPTWIDLAGNLSMFQYYLNIRDIDGPYWTMIVEMLFYLLIALFFATRKLNAILPFGILTIGFIIINDIWLESYFPGLLLMHQWFPLINHLPLFLSGIVFYKLITETQKPSQQIGYYFFLFCCYIAQLLLFDNGGQSASRITLYQYTFVLAFFYLLFVLFSLKMLGFLVNKYTLFFGKISFSLYLVHQYLSTEIIIPGLIKYLNFNFWIAAGIALFITVTLAAAITYLIEIPSGKMMNAWLRRKTGLPARVA